jgi:hypothetical protein
MNNIIEITSIKNVVFELRGQKVILDRDLAKLYSVKSKQLNRQVKRNFERFPEDFMFRITKDELKSIITQSVRSVSRCQIGTMKQRGKNIKYLPYAFTRNGINMLATVLRSKIAIQRSIFIMRAFSALEQAISVSKRKDLETPDIVKQLSVHSKAIMHLFRSDKQQTINIDKLRNIQEGINNLMQRMILLSLKEDE